MMEYLKKVSISLLFGMGVLVLGAFYPLIYLFVFTLLTPIFLLLINFSGNVRIDKGVFIALFILFLIDLLFRIYGGGTHDQVGKALCDISLFIGVCITIAIFIFFKIRAMRGGLKLDVFLKKILLPALGWFLFSFGVYYLISNF